MSLEAWLSGPVEGVPGLLTPVAHALQQSKRELRAAAEGLGTDELWQQPAGAASVGFHLRHIAGSIDRLLAYARGAQLDHAQLSALRAETVPVADATADGLLAEADAAIDRVLDVLKRTPEPDLLAPREVGRKRLPTTILGLLFHIAEHTARHTGQTIVTSRVVHASAGER